MQIFMIKPPLGAERTEPYGVGVQVTEYTFKNKEGKEVTIRTNVVTKSAFVRKFVGSNWNSLSRWLMERGNTITMVPSWECIPRRKFDKPDTKPATKSATKPA